MPGPSLRPSKTLAADAMVQPDSQDILRRAMFRAAVNQQEFSNHLLPIAIAVAAVVVQLARTVWQYAHGTLQANVAQSAGAPPDVLAGGCGLGIRGEVKPYRDDLQLAWDSRSSQYTLLCGPASHARCSETGRAECSCGSLD